MWSNNKTLKTHRIHWVQFIVVFPSNYYVQHYFTTWNEQFDECPDCIFGIWEKISILIYSSLSVWPKCCTLKKTKKPNKDNTILFYNQTGINDITKGVLMVTVVSDLPPSSRYSRLVLLRCLLLCKASFPSAVPAAQEALPGGPHGRGLPAGYQPSGTPPSHPQLD